MVWFIPLERPRHCLVLLIVAAACNPYDYQKGEFNAGPVDAANFPKPYQGAGADTNVNGYLAGKGKFNEIAAFIGGTPAGYYSFPFSATQVATGVDSLRIVEDGHSYKPLSSSPAIPVPTAYVFDPSATDPFPVRQTCTAPAGYSYNPQTDDVRGDEQDNIFTQLPFATEKPGVAATFDYIPVVAESAVSAGARACQSIKSEETLLKVLGAPSATGKYILWAIIDPSSGVYRVGQSSTFLLSDGGHDPNYSHGVGTQRWGWFGHYYLAYIDGGYVPTETASVTEGSPPRTKQVVRMKTQRLYFPRTISSAAVRCGSTTCTPGQVCASGSCQTCQASGARACPSGFTCGTTAPLTGVCTASGAQGAGYDVLVARRSDANYSPVCEVWTYTANTLGARPLSISELPKSETDITALPAPAPAQVTGTGRFIYCPQVD
jgi:hypothetical protein